MFKVNNRNTSTSCEICSELTIVSIVNFEHVNADWEMHIQAFTFSSTLC